MAEIDNVVPGEVIEANWGNQIRDRTIQRYLDETERATANPVPAEGDLSYLESTKVVEVFDDSEWAPVSGEVYLRSTGGTIVDGPLTLQDAFLWFFNTSAGGAIRWELTDDGELAIINQAAQRLLTVAGPVAGEIAKFQNLPENQPQNVTFLNNWGDFFTPCRTTKTPSGVVVFNGATRATEGVPSGPEICQIIEDHRPPNTLLLSRNISGAGEARQLSIQSDGICIADGDLPGSGQWFSFEGLSWYRGW